MDQSHEDDSQRYLGEPPRTRYLIGWFKADVDFNIATFIDNYDNYHRGLEL